ncbi:MAG TPA: xanthine dehydrogenase family protein molybdopterin-binding subunit [Candidatus Binatia bacterium]|nr:xanthine dehydrogenase family protein molybdopterin-binding subunit [Candidatus Binatia bacterium]
MTTEHNSDGLIGASIRRVEDPLLISGKGCYVDDINLPGMLHMMVLRSAYPHAKIVSMDTGTARSMKGVVAVVTGPELPERLNINAQVMFPGQKIPPHPVLARGAVHAPGTPVAAVVAESRAIAQDACNAIEVEYQALPSIQNAEDALKPGAPLAREELDSNICYTAVKKGGDVDKAFAQADHIVRMHIVSPRQVALAIEPRGVAANPDPMGKSLTVWLSTQGPHRARADLAGTLGIAENKIRLIAPDVGGGFGSKGPLYREDVLTSYLALKLRRPVKWIATRSDDFVTTIQGRDQAMTSELALKKDGTMLGLKVRVVANLGGYLQSSTAGPPQRMMAMAPGCYQIRDCHVEVVGVFTNTVPTGPYRGAGRPESVLNIERLIDKAAKDLGIDRLEIRRKNFIRPEQFPYKTAVGMEYDSGDYFKSLDEAIKISNYKDLLRQRDERRERGEIVGVGVSTFVEPSGGAGFESGTVRIERTGEITVLTGSSSHGQGHETVWAQIAAEMLKTDMEHVTVLHGDTYVSQQGTGTFGSRSAVVGGGALATAAQRVIEKAKRIAAHLVEASAEDMVQADGGFSVAGVPEKKVTWRQIAAAAYGGKIPPGMENGLQETCFFDPRREAWGYGAHVCVVSINRETGEPKIEKLVLVDDCGVLINPMIVEGQIHGGVAQGLGEALREQMVYSEDGQVLTGTLMNYAVMRATDMPPLTLGETVTPNPFHPLGVKGVGEAGTNGAPPAVANAVMDALAPLGIDHIDMPYTAPKLWQAIRRAGGTSKP